MGMTTVTMLAPANTTKLSNEIKRPAITVYYSGATGPFTIDYIWDDDSNFGNANGRQQTAQTTGLIPTSGSESKAPGADLGLLTDGTTWYVKVTVTDTNDAGSLADNHSFDYLDPQLQDQWLYVDANVGFGFKTTDEPVERQFVANDATAGTFTLTLSGQTTGSLDWDATPAEVETALELLSNVTDVEVRGLPTAGNGWEVLFLDVDPDPVPLMTATDTLTGGSTTIKVFIDDGDAWGTSAEGGTEGPDGDPQDQNRFLYQIANVGFAFTRDEPTGGWGTGGTTAADGDAVAQNRFLYQVANVDGTLQPCPYIFDLSQTTIKTGQSLTVTGQGLVSATSPTADAYDAEVRLYESASFSAAYVVLSVTDYADGDTEDTIEVTIPGGASSGFVAVVHTTGATCTGSNFKALTVQAVDADRNAGWWIEIWNLRNSTPIIRPLPYVYSADFENIANDIGRGSITIPADHPDLADIIDRDASPPVQTLVKIYLHSRFAYSFIPIDKSDPWVEDGAARVRIYGPGQEQMLRWARALWFDYPNQPSSARVWIHGSTENALNDGDMEPASAIENGGAEDATTVPWAAVGTTTLFATTDDARTGSYSIQTTPTALNGGCEIEAQVEDGFRCFADLYVKDPAGPGNTIEARVLDSNGTTVLDSASVSSSSNWQKLELEWVPDAGGAGNTETNTIQVRLTAGTVRKFYVDDAAVYTRPDFDLSRSRCDVGLSRDYVAEGLHSLKYEPDAGADNTFNGTVTTFPIDAGEIYQMSLAVTGPVGEDMRVGLRLGGILDEVVHTFTGLGTWDVLTLSGQAAVDDETGRFAISGRESAATSFYVDDIKITPGENANNFGHYVTEVLDAAQTRGTLDFVQTDFDGTLDSNGDAWPETLALEIQPEWTLFDVLEKAVGFGYDWEFAPTNFRAGGDSGWTLRLFSPQGIGSDWSIAPDGPAVLPGPGIESADPSGAPPLSTVVYAEGVEGVWSTVSADAAVLTALERREDFLKNRAAGDAPSLFRSASHRLDVASSRGAAHTVGFVGLLADPLPYFDFLVSDRLRVHLPKEDRDLVPDATYQVAAIAATLGPPTQVRFAVDFGLYRLTADRARTLLLNRLLERQETENYLPGTGSVRELRG